MDALRLTLRAELRRRWRPMLGLALLLGVIGGVVLTAAAGARRTDTAYPRLLRSASAAQLLLISDQHGPAGVLHRSSAACRRWRPVGGQTRTTPLLPGPHGPSGTRSSKPFPALTIRSG